ncbi:General amino-acid permease GAP1 [Venustampulla echinocandica]|uniref:General amino-acid permease GAP1 n=1 Tax=Venustampulla echinocandica TaxID=2656787 RepID=A0A370TL51_9HELO|nr:General amino-acid permease GAP1 [Venustampulla echinocandica]RDL36249.1 General amino-acid permease GAP1 [Venustampulla echinocandica]
MADKEPPEPEPLKNGITYTRDFEVTEMSDLAVDKSRTQFTSTASYSVSTIPRAAKPSGKQSFGRQWVNSFRRVPGMPMTEHRGYQLNDGMPDTAHKGDHFYDLRAANARTANSALVRDLKGRHLQMIAIGGSIGTGLFVASGLALYQSGPVSTILAYILTGAFQLCTMQSLGELVVVFPVAGSFSAFSTRFLDPSWGFAMGWNYALQWLFVMPIEIIAGALTIRYWNQTLDSALFVTIFLLTVVMINLMGVKGYGEAEFLFSTIKVTAIIGFILITIVINIGGAPHEGYIGGKYWHNPGPTNNGFKGFCNALSTSAFSFAGTELVGLAAAETANPKKSIPSAMKQVFWRIALFYIVTLLLVSLLVPYNDPRLLGGPSAVGVSVSPFVLAVENAGKTILPSVMNAVILVAVLSVGNSAIFGSSRTLAALAEQSHAPKIFSYIDRKGRPLVAIMFAAAIGLLSYLASVKIHSEIFDWLLAVCALSSIFTWGSICLCHIRFRRAWATAGQTLDQLPFRSQVGVIGSYVGLIGNGLVLVSQVWMGISPVQTSDVDSTSAEAAKNFFLKVMTVPIVLIFYAGHKIWFRTRILSIRAIDIDTGNMSFSRTEATAAREKEKEARKRWLIWKRVYRTLC